MPGPDAAGDPLFARGGGARDGIARDSLRRRQRLSGRDRVGGVGAGRSALPRRRHPEARVVVGDRPVAAEREDRARVEQVARAERASGAGGA